MICRWEHLSRDEIAAIDKDNTLVIMPVASIEQHGPHLPVGTDKMILDALLRRMIEKGGYEEANVLIAPVLPIGKSNEHMHFAGTMTFGTQHYYSILFDIAKSIANSGFKKILMMNSHGGNTDMLNMISRDMRIELGIEVFVFDWWFTPFWNEGLEGLKQSGKYGVFHACELETSLMLAEHPDLVRMDLAVDEDPVPALGEGKYVTILGPFTAGWKTEDVTHSGVIGAPTYATAEKGEKLFDYAVNKISDIIAEILQINY